MSVTEFVPDDEAEHIATEFETTLEERRPAAIESAFETADGDRIPYEFTGGPLEEADGRLRGVTGVGRDLTERKTHERELERTNERLEEFASIVSHDLRNPLNVAEGRLDLLSEECDSEHIDSIDRTLGRMSELIEDILTLAREGDRVSGTEPVDLADLSGDGWRNVETADAAMRTPTTRSIRTDRSRLAQLLENLIRNSVEHGSTGSRPRADDAVEHGSTNSRTGSGDSVEHGGDDVTITVGDLADGFYVEDDGPGIPEDERDDVFEAGYSTIEGGTGFGLSIVEQVADAHGWDVRVTAGTDGGARFEITGVEFVDE